MGEERSPFSNANPGKTGVGVLLSLTLLVEAEAAPRPRVRCRPRPLPFNERPSTFAGALALVGVGSMGGMLMRVGSNMLIAMALSICE